MRIAYTMTTGRGDTDSLLFSVAQEMIRAGRRPCGVVQFNTEIGDDRPCDMDVQVLPDGPVLRISQSLGPGASGCRLDPDALERSVGLVAAGLASAPDVLIVNKFGKQEAAGGGFRDVISQALLLGIPVLVGLNASNEDAFRTFADGLAEPVDPTREALLAWILEPVADAT